MWRTLRALRSAAALAIEATGETSDGERVRALGLDCADALRPALESYRALALRLAATAPAHRDQPAAPRRRAKPPRPRKRPPQKGRTPEAHRPGKHARRGRTNP